VGDLSMSLGMGEANTRIFWKFFLLFLLIVILVVLSAGCSTEEYWSAGNRFSWSTSIQTLESFDDPWLDREIEEDVHAECRETHHIDPYTKVEYCLPDDLTKIANLNFYKVEK
tara:strand:+ start:816 stop:1154 length:339 start_codon:yes stop_codon:yes gene_type:complete